MSERKSRHLEPIEIVALLEGRLSFEERSTLLAHVTTCAVCSTWLAETHAALQVNDSLPQGLFYHPFEQFLSLFRRLIPWPTWV